MRPDWTLRRNSRAHNAPSGILPELEKSLGWLLLQTLRARGLHEAAAIESFLNPRLEQLQSPFSLKNMRAASARLAEAVKAGESVCIYGDYDMDGTSGLCLLYEFLREVGPANPIRFYQPARFDEGYGLHAAAVEKLAAEGVRVLVSVDTGSTALEAAHRAKALGVTLIITDHHQLADELPDTPFLLNPHQPGDESGLGYLSGAGMAFYMAMALRATLREQGFFNDGRVEPDIRKLLDLYVLGTIGDVVDLKGDNRALVRAGLKMLQSTTRPGLRALCDAVMEPNRAWSARDVAFSLVPKLNAASRMGRAELSTELLMCRDPVRSAVILGEVLDLNASRSDVQAKVTQEALVQAEIQKEQGLPLTIVRGAWHEGVLGIVAAKLADRFFQPAIVLTEIEGGRLLRGSMRSRQGFSCIDILRYGAHHLRRHGGHQAAAGMEMEAEHFETFVRDLNIGFESLLDQREAADSIEFDLELDRPLALQELLELEKMAPWGAGNPEPLLFVREVPIASVDLLKAVHIKGRFRDRHDLIGFNKATEWREAQESGAQTMDLLVVPELNRFREQIKIQLRIEHLRASPT